MSYAPSADFDFTGLTGYSPSPNFDFSGGTAQPYDLAFGQQWALEAPAVIVNGALSQEWALHVAALANTAFNQQWALVIYDYQDVALDQSWAIAAPTFRNIGADHTWALSAPIFRNTALDHAWALPTPAFANTWLDQRWALQTPTFADTFIVQEWALIAPQGGNIAMDQQWRIEATAVWSKVISATAYLFALEQGSDRAEIPISNFSMQLRSGEPSYLQASIPNAWAHAETVAAYAAHADSEMVIHAGYRWSDDSYTTQEIARVTLRNVRYDYGARSASVSLDGADTRTNATPATHALTGASYLNQDSDGRLRYRVTPNFAVRPGDTVTVGNDTFVVGELSYQVSASSASMEVAELVEP